MSTQRIPDIDQMAKRFADLWSDQWRQMMTHPETAANMMKLAEMMGPSQNMAQSMMSRFFTPETQGAKKTTDYGFSKGFGSQASPPPASSSNSSSSIGPEAFAAAFGSLARQLDELALCLVDVTKRLDALEKPKRAKPRAKSVAKPAAKSSTGSRVKRAQPARRPAAKPARKGR